MNRVIKEAFDQLSAGNPKAIEFFDEIEDMFSKAHAVIDPAMERAKFILENINNTTMEDFYNMPSVDGMTLLAVIAISTEKETAIAEKIFRERSTGGKSRFAKVFARDKEEVRNLWKEWEKSPDKYRNKTDFDETVGNQLGRATQTVAKWRLEFQRG
jgi:hypothetical protein